jgi:membrane-associated phospholipid phosphatase
MRLTTLSAIVLVAGSAAAAPTFVLRSPAEIPVPPPAEVKKTTVEALDAEERADMVWWSAGAPGYRWNSVAFDLFKQSSADVVSERVISSLHVAIHDATLAADHYQRAYRTGYPSIHAAAGGAASAVLTHFFPDKADDIKVHAQAAAAALTRSGTAQQNEVDAGIALGRAVGARVVDRLRNDGADKPWEGSVPAGPGKWVGQDPAMPQIATWKPWILAKPDALRPPAPPSFDDKAMAEVRDPANLTGSRKRAAYQWAITSLLRHFNDEASLRIFEGKIDRDPVRAAEIYAVLNAAYYDALIACWDAKYAYWGMRPINFDPAFKSQITTPNFPGYPSGHAIFAGVASTILAHYFPRDKAKFEATATEIASSRLYGGVHFRADNEVGLQMGRTIAAAALKRTLDSSASPAR